ncbi:MAG TPA: tripartite tricarboxylate transporter permease [archaeon]|nr:tripartite tricarboxylate transporter permease [archaeon]
MDIILETLFLSLLGVAIGIAMGVIPGAHINNILPILLLVSLSLNLDPYYMAVLIVSTAMAEIFTNFIPSIFLGAPDESTALSVLPGHRLLLEGRGYEAIKLTVIGGIGSLMSSLVFIALLAPWFSYLYEISRPYVQYMIAGVAILMIISERKIKKMLSAVLIFFLSGFLGIITLGSSLVPQQNVLFPLLTGMFGLSTIAVSMFQRSKIPEQKEETEIKIPKNQILKSIVLGTFAGLIVGFLPAIGISEAATMVQYIGRTGDASNFLVTLSGINVGNEVFSLISLALVGNPRSGPSVAIQTLLNDLTFFDVFFFVGVICFVSGIAALSTLYLGKRIPKYLARIDYRKLCIAIISFLTIMIFLLTGPFGLLIAFTSTSIGLLCTYLEIKRSHCMACLLLPSILFFSGLSITMATILRI